MNTKGSFLEQDDVSAHFTIQSRSVCRPNNYFKMALLHASQEEINELETQVQELIEKEAEVKKRMEELDHLYTHKSGLLNESMSKLVAEREAVEKQLAGMLTEPAPHRPGPEWVRFVEGTPFVTCCAIVIVVNIVMMIQELQHPSYAVKWWAFDQLFLAWYVLELALKATLMYSQLLFGPVGEVWWNWLDVFIVTSGVLEQWVQPVLTAVGLVDDDSGHGGGMSVAGVLRLLRLARLARILKVARLFFESDLSWTEGPRFQFFIMGVIGFNSILMGFETDIPDFVGWYYVEMTLLAIYSFELAVRMKRVGCNFFYNQDFFWNYMDFSIVMGGLIDQCLLPFISMVRALVTGGAAHKISIGQGIVLLRMARLLRILRLVRLIKSVPQLFNLLVAIMEAMQGVSWVLVLTLVVLYACSILAVRLIGHGLIFGGSTPEDLQDIFPTVPESVFVLFTTMNGDASKLEPLLNRIPLFKLIFSAFMIMTSWAILSILTAVVSEKMISVTEHAHEQRMAEIKRADEQRQTVRLTEIFHIIDTDDSGTVDEDEFRKMLDDPVTCENICEETEMEKCDMLDLFGIMAEIDEETGHRVITHKGFIKGMKEETLPVTARHVLRLDRRIHDVIEMMQTMQTSNAQYHKWTVEKLQEMSGNHQTNAYQDSSSPAPL